MLLFRVWMGILGIQDLTKIRRRNQQNLKSWWVRDLTAPQEVGLTKIWAWDAGFLRLLVGNLGNRLDLNKRSSWPKSLGLLLDQTTERAC